MMAMAQDPSIYADDEPSDDDSMQVRPSHVHESYDDYKYAQPSTQDNDEAPEKDEEKYQPNNRCGVDIGNVLSKRYKNWGYKVQTWRYADPSGAYAFCMLFCLAYGAENLFPVSRTNNGTWHTFDGKYEAWVVRFIRDLGLFDMGVPEDNLKICSEWWEKAEIALNLDLAQFIDDRLECLMGVFSLVPDCDLWCYTNDERGPFFKRDSRGYPFDVQQQKVFFNSLSVCDNWRTMASNCDLENLLNFTNYSFNDIWEYLIIHGPPNKPHTKWLMNWVQDELHQPVITTTIVKQEPDSEPEHETQPSVPKPYKTTLETGRVAEFGAQPSVQKMTIKQRAEWEHGLLLKEWNEAKAKPSRPKPTKLPSPEKPEATQHTQKKYKPELRQPREPPPMSITHLLQHVKCQPGGSLPSTQTVHPQTAPEADSDAEPDASQSWGKGKGEPDSDDELDDEIDNYAPEEAAPATRAISWPRMPPGMPPPTPWQAIWHGRPVRWRSDGQEDNGRQRDRCKEEDMAPEAQPEATHSNPKSTLKQRKRMADATQPCCQPPPTHLGRKPAAVPDDGTDRIAHRSTIPTKMLLTGEQFAYVVDVSTPEQTAANMNCIFCSSDSDVLCQDCMEPVCNECIVGELNICAECDCRLRESETDEDDSDKDNKLIQHGDSSVTDPAWVAWEQHIKHSMVSRSPPGYPARTQGPEVASPPNNDKEQEAMEAYIEAVIKRKMHDIVIMANGGDQPDQRQRPTRTFPATAMKWAAAVNGPNSKGLVKWAAQRKQRAADHHAALTRLRSSPSAPSCSATLNVITPMPLCVGCHKGQPGKYCSFWRCFNCCRTHRGSAVCQQPCHKEDD